MKMHKVVLILVLLAVLLPASVVEAQDMHVQYYLIPVQVVNETKRGPSYLKWRFNSEGLDVPWMCLDYGLIDMMICAVDAEQTDHDYLEGQADVYQFPVNIEANPSPAELAELETILEVAYIPAAWLTPADTWRQTLRTISGMFLFMQRLTGITGSSPLDWGVGLNTQFRNLDQVYQDAIVEAFDTLGYDSSTIKTNWTLRIILKEAADQWGDRPIYFDFTTL